MCVLMCVYCVKGCITPVKLCVVDRVDPPQGGRVSVLVLL